MRLMTSEPMLTKPVWTELLPLEETARETLGELQIALNELVARVPGESSRAVDLQRGLGLEKKLAWQLFKFINAPDPIPDVAHVPGEPSMKRVLSAASRRKVPRETIDRAAAAFKRFEAFVAEHGDRSDLISMAGGLGSTGVGDLQHDIKTRKSVFKGMSHIWGIKAELSIASAIFGSRSPGVQDTTGVRGDIGLQRLRRGVPLTAVVYTRNNPASGSAGASPWQGVPKPLLQSAPAQIGLHLLEEFCTQPLPQMESRVQADGAVETDLVFPPSGRSGAITLYGTQHIPGTAQGDQRVYSNGMTVRIPSERLVCEMLVPEGWSNPASVRVAVYGRRDMVHRTFERRKEDLLPQRETAVYIGTMETSPSVPGAPQHPKAVRYALEQVGWLGTRYDVYRCIVEYPVLHTMISLDVDAMPNPT